MKVCSPFRLPTNLNSHLTMAGCARITFWFLMIIPFTNAKPQSFHYSNFTLANLKLLNLEGNASISDSGIQLTRDGVQPDSNGIGTLGRVTYSEHVHLWDSRTKQQKDFTTHFSFAVFSNQSSYGDGLAFFLASPELLNENNTAKQTGGSLGIGLGDINQTLLQTDYQFVALEFDTFSNEYDPDGAHVGVNVNSMSSEMLVEWWTDIPNGRLYNCSIEYSSRSNDFKVFFTGYISNGDPVTQYLSYQVDTKQALPEMVVVGISAATGGHSEKHTLLSWSFRTSLPSTVADFEKGRDLIKSKLLEGIGIGVVVPLVLLGLVHILLWMMNIGKEEKEEEATSETASDQNMDDEFQKSSGPKKICYYELLTATNNFEETQKLGQGGFGGVYKGYFRNSNSYAAVKRISANSKQGLKQYTAEVKIISQLRHRNLVKLAGWCHKKTDLLLIYEYMPNGSLDSHIFRGKSILSWQVRYSNIAQGLASALLYLQEECGKCVLHRDIKSSNIMLDSDFNAKLGDFGLARFVDSEKGSQTTVVAGTMGYLAPEYMHTGKARKESDIFSFGVVLLEIATGRKAIDYQDMEVQETIVEWVWQLYGLGNILAAADPKLCGVFDVQQMECLLVVGLWCANPDCRSRPSIRQVIKVLNFEAPLPVLSQSVPALMYLPWTTNELFFTVSSSLKATC
ncbi:L-type lectin-domain containing receptor kinase IX.1-like [Lotus japonicus]|uniref:L-type lectin-domain containing receptor kinase IX.1-like n=1 Tax=Lotus japonicus TaxID=34305 RepID=UPI0025825BAE|nr:L-type lectin-domain containing receptor kinase IX.1-like [Lotus japonicus]